MKKIWKEEVEELNKDFIKEKSNRRAARNLPKTFKLPDEKLSNFFIRRYLDRCKFKYVLAFL